MHTTPAQPLEELEYQRKENQRLRLLLQHIAIDLQYLWIDEHTEAELQDIANKIKRELASA